MIIGTYYENAFNKKLLLEKFCGSRLTVVSHEVKEEVPCEGLSTNAHEYFTRTNLAKIKNAITYEPYSLALYNSRFINILSKYNLQTKAKA